MLHRSHRRPGQQIGSAMPWARARVLLAVVAMLASCTGQESTGPSAHPARTSPSPTGAPPASPSPSAVPSPSGPSVYGTRPICTGSLPGTIWTVAGTRDFDTGGAQDAGKGDGRPATSAQLDGPYEVLLDAVGNIYIAEDGNHDDWNLGRVRMVDVAGLITTVVGPPTPGGASASGEAGTLEMYTPWGMAFDPEGALHVSAGVLPTADIEAGYVYRIGASGKVEVVAGGPIHEASTGDGGPATKATFVTVRDLYFDTAGTLYITDIEDARVRAVDKAGEIRTFAGTGIAGFSGDGGPAVDAQLQEPERVAADSNGNIYITDAGNGRVRMVDREGTIRTVAGGGAGSDPGDGRRATDAVLRHPFGIVVADDGTLYIADAEDQRIRKVDPSGTISTVAGLGVRTGGDIVYGDGGPATEASFNDPASITIGPDGNLYVADWENARIRMICQ